MAFQEKDLRLIAKFFYKHRNYGAWWTPQLLVQQKEAQSFGLSIHEAELVFQVFEQKGFVKKYEKNKQPTAEDDYQKYQFDLVHIRELREYGDIPFWYKYISEDTIHRIEKLKTWFIVSFALIITSFLQVVAKDVYALLKTFINKLIKSIG